MQEPNEFGSHSRLPRQQSLSAVGSSRCSMGCIGGGRRGRSLADFEFDGLFRDWRGCFSGNGHRALTAGGGNADDNTVINEFGTNKDADANSDNSDDIFYKAPSHWQAMCRKVRAEARRNMRRRPTTSPFRYDSLSYAMNFDNGAPSTPQEHDDVGNPRLRTQLSGPVYCL